MRGYCCLRDFCSMRWCGQIRRASKGALAPCPPKISSVRDNRSVVGTLRFCPPCACGSIPCDDLALALVNVGGIEQIAAAPAHQEFRPPRPDRVVTPAPRRGFARLVFQQLRDPPGGCDLVAVGTDAQRNGQ